MISSDPRLSRARLAAFAALEIPMAAFLTPLVVYIPSFYASEKGLGLATVGLVFGLTKLWDIITDPVAGTVMERLGPAQGRWRFWLLMSLPLMLLGVYRIFLPPESVDWQYFAFWMVILYVGWTLLTISHISWGVELAADYHGRARVAAYRQLAGLLGGLLIVAIPVVTDQLSGADESLRIKYMGLFVLVALPLLTYTAIAAVPATTSLAVPEGKHRWYDALLLLKNHRPLHALLLCNMAVLLGLAAMSSSLLFYAESVLRLGRWASFAIVPALLSGLAFLPLLKLLTVRLGKVRTFRWLLGFQVAVQPLFLIIPAESLVLAVTAFLLLGAINGGVVFLPQAIIADLKDRRTRVGSYRTGLYVALLQSSSKLSAALAVALMFLVLPLTSFDAAAGPLNEAGSLDRLRILICCVPMLCYGFAWLMIRSYAHDKGADAPGQY